MVVDDYTVRGDVRLVREARLPAAISPLCENSGIIV